VLVQGPQGPLIVAGNAGGAFAAWDARTARRAWQRDFGALGPAWPAGETLYVATSEPSVQRLALVDGRTLWRTELAAWEDPDDREDAIAYGAPVLAGGRVLVTSSDGRLLAFDPETGERLSEIEVPDGSSTGVAVAGGTVYMLTDAGDLLAYR
jgi:outer membrane protein assembly factor BamB